MYLYLDAAYFRRAMSNRLAEVGVVGARPRWKAVAAHFRAARTFLYDCRETVRRTTESEDDYQRRIESQQAEARSIGLLDGFFLRLGSHRGTPGRTRQKEVDVLLAVDMLTHAQRRITNAVTLLAGDLDFKPVVESVVELGVAVTVAFEPKSGSVDLALAADRRHQISLFDLWRMSDGYLERAGNPPSITSHDRKWYSNGPRVKKADSEVGPVYLCQSGAGWALDFTELATSIDYPYWSSSDQLLLLSWAEKDFGTLAWQDDWPGREA